MRLSYYVPVLYIPANVCTGTHHISYSSKQLDRKLSAKCVKQHYSTPGWLAYYKAKITWPNHKQNWVSAYVPNKRMRSKTN